jgi:hypothetical protein
MDTHGFETCRVRRKSIKKEKTVELEATEREAMKRVIRS